MKVTKGENGRVNITLTKKEVHALEREYSAIVDVREGCKDADELIVENLACLLDDMCAKLR